MSGPDFALHGAPDTLIGSPDAKAKAVQVMQIDLTAEILDELLHCVKSGKAPQILFGRNPTIKYAGKSHVLEPTTEKYRNELYAVDDADDEDGWAFSGLINHSLAIQQAKEAFAGTDKALEALKNNMAMMEQEKEAQTSILEPALTSNKLPPKARNGLLQKPLASGSGRAFSGSLSLAASSSPIRTPARTSAPFFGNPQNDAIQQAARTPIVHLLAVEPLTIQDVARKLRIPKDTCSEVVKHVGKQTESKQWQLSERLYKELDPYKFPYATADRERAVDNAVRVFDRMRLSQDDSLWQKLLPQEKRGKGIVLSRLQLRDAFTPGATPPVVPKTTIDKKTGLPKKTEVRKADKEGKGKAKGKKDEGADQVKKAAKDNKDSTKVKAPTDKAKERRSKAQGTTLSQTNGTHTPDPRPGSERKMVERARPAAQKVQTTHKPKNPSPLSASPPLNASDFEDDHHIHKTLAASPRPTTPPKPSADRPPKRKSNDLDSDSQRDAMPPKRLRKTERLHASAAAKTSAATQPKAGLKRKITSSESDQTTPTKQRKLETPDTSSHRTTSSSHRQPQPGSSPMSDSSTSPPVTVSWRQTIELARRFQRYYGQYEKLWHELANAPESPTPQRRAELEKMHQKLADMKKEIREASRRQDMLEG